MRTVARLTVALAGAAVLILGGAGTASADHYTGDRGNNDGVTCSSGEICFSEHSDGGGGARHFWWGAEHDHAGNFTSGVPLYHNASALRNRDTVSAVCVEESGDLYNDRWLFPSGAAYFVNFAYDLNDENARHWRGGC